MANYGNGILQYEEKSFCSNDDCQDVTVCKLVTDEGEEKYYIPVDQSLNKSRANGSGDKTKMKGHTSWDAIRILQNDDGLFIKLNDPTFSRTRLTKQQYTWQNYVHLTLALDCQNQQTTSTANLTGTNVKFSPSILPYHAVGFNASGGGTLSLNNQKITVTSKGWCGKTYFASIGGNVPNHDNHSRTGQHLLSVTF